MTTTSRPTSATDRGSRPQPSRGGPRGLALTKANASEWLSALVATRRRQTLLALLAYSGFTVFLTWPLLIHLDSAIYTSPGRPRGDYTSTIAYLHQLVDGWHNPFLPGTLDNFNAPHGAPIDWVLNVASFASWIVLYPLAVIFGATAAFGIFTMLGFAASAIAMFLLVRRLTGSFGAAVILGFAFGFFPYVVANGEHPHYIHGWVFVLMAWRMIELFERPTVRNGILAGLASLVTIGWTPYFLLLGGVLFATLFASSLVIAAFQGTLQRQLGPQLIAAGIALGFVVLLRGLAAIDAEAAVIGNAPLIDLYLQSARPANLLVPNGHNPIFGDWTRPYLLKHGWYDATEKTLYVGISLCLLALVGGVAALRRWVPERSRLLALVFSAVVFVGLAFSAPPKVGVAGTQIPLPPYFVWQVQSGWRIYERFVIIVMVGLCIVTAIGIQALTRRRGSSARIAIIIAIAILVPLDLWSKFEPNTARLSEPAIYGTLRELPDGIVAEYPIEPREYGLDYDELYNQQFHGKPILNGFPPRGADEARAVSLANLGERTTPGRLAAGGVRYVLLKHDTFNPYSLDPGRPGRDLELIEKSAFADLYLVTARSANP